MISREFRDAFCNMGTPVKTCMCGVTYFAGACGEFEEGEFETLLAKQSIEPKRYVCVSDMHAISWGILAGEEFVYHCENCPRAKKYENFIVEYRDHIITFLKGRAKRLTEEAAEDCNRLKAEIEK